MAETDRHDRTEQATQKRLDDARKRGQIPRSRDLTAAAVMLIAGLGLLGLGKGLGAQLAEGLRAGLTVSAAEMQDPDGMLTALKQSASSSLFAVAPVLGLTLLAALGAPLALGGWSFSTQGMTPNFGRLNPVAGLGRMVSLRGWVEMAKALGKFAIVATAGATVLWTKRDALLGLASEPVAVGHRTRLLARRHGAAVAHRFAGADRRDRRAVPALAAQARPEDDQGRDPQGSATRAKARRS